MNDYARVPFNHHSAKLIPKAEVPKHYSDFGSLYIELTPEDVRELCFKLNGGYVLYIEDNEYSVFIGIK